MDHGLDSGCLGCGSDTVDGAEVCDGSDLDGQTCIDRGFAGGELACSGHCQVFDTADCVLCFDDAEEPDDSATDAHLVDFSAGASRWNSSVICAGDDDWFEVSLLAGETLYATLAFSQAGPEEDLDLLLFREWENLTGCDEINPAGCDALNGQSRTSDESLSWTFADAGTYHLVVHGWQGAANVYDLCISLDANDCP